MDCAPLKKSHAQPRFALKKVSYPNIGLPRELRPEVPPAVFSARLVRLRKRMAERELDAIGVVESTDLRSLPYAAVLDYAQPDGRIVLTRNVSDFSRLDVQWRSEGRPQGGIVLVTERAFPQNRNLVGALVAALLAASDASTLPGAGELLYLQRPARVV